MSSDPGEHGGAGGGGAPDGHRAPDPQAGVAGHPAGRPVLVPHGPGPQRGGPRRARRLDRLQPLVRHPACACESTTPSRESPPKIDGKSDENNWGANF